MRLLKIYFLSTTTVITVNNVENQVEDTKPGGSESNNAYSSHTINATVQNMTSDKSEIGASTLPFNPGIANSHNIFKCEFCLRMFKSKSGL